jgi:MYXO-CTERM domain-containing protein
MVVAALAFPARAHAYEPRETHRWLTRMAAEHLVRAYPGTYDELLDYVDVVAEGAEHEDNFFLDGDDDPETLRVMRHFFRPTDGAGLALGEGERFPSSLEWALPNDLNAWHWGNGIAAYASGDKNEAYFVLGHIVHLVQDLTVPAHTHLDIHPPPFGDDFENYAKSMMLGEFDSLLPVPPADAPVPAFENLETAWLATANASFWRNRYPGNLRDPDAPGGVIVNMFPSIEMHWFFDTWHIPEPQVGFLDTSFFEDAEEPGWFYFKNLKKPARVDRMAFDPSEPGDLSGLEANVDEVPMVELLARDLVPLAIVHSAGVMKLYLDEAFAKSSGDAGDDQPRPGSKDAVAGCATAQGGGSGALALLAIALYPLVRHRSAS